MARKGGLTPEKSRVLAIRRRELVAQGKIKMGRPKGSLNLATIAKINSRESFITEGQKLAGKWLADLHRNSDEGDTRATLGALDRVGIIAVQKIEHEHKFSLVNLADARTQLPPKDVTHDMHIIETPINVSEDEDE